jgi:hypothetical protein
LAVVEPKSMRGVRKRAWNFMVLVWNEGRQNRFDIFNIFDFRLRWIDCKLLRFENLG